MADQAEALRRMMDTNRSQRTAERIVAIASGKGGVGKSNVAVNLAVALQRLGRSAIVIDLDIGFTNVELLLGARSRRRLTDVLHGTDIWDVINHSASGVSFITSGTQFADFGQFTPEQLITLVNQLKRLHEQYDFILLDGSAGMTANSQRLISAADDMLLIVTPEPTSIADAYSFVKFLYREHSLPTTHIVTNRAQSFVDAKNAAAKIQSVCTHFLNVSLSILGYVLDDVHVPDAVRKQTAVMTLYPNTLASKCIMQVAKNYLNAGESREEVQLKRGFAAWLDNMFRK
ncbi:AAA family ATPase [Alicyclobacillus ferrooxydans]|uniref:AAA family ATPase n=1 Tax=Alicyclobacillus ferrooxydans TaxID=471514 RepID=UPI0006D5317F|nr:AAA family ATPase [Alicyclobacillus ferrooxydans]